MAIKRGSKVTTAFSMASMSDIVFLLMVFLLIATTQINPNAIRVVLPRSSNQVKEKAMTSVSITADNMFYVEAAPVSEEELEAALKAKLEGVQEPIIRLNVDENASWGKAYHVMDIATRNRYQILASGRNK